VLCSRVVDGGLLEEDVLCCTVRFFCVEK
jgi:hypothetical protein